MKKPNDWKIRTQILLLLAITIVLMVSALVGYNTWYMLAKNRRDAEAFGKEELAKINNNLENFVNIAYETIESNYRNSENKAYLEDQYGYRLQNIIDLFK